MLINKKKDMTPFDMNRRPSKQYFFLLPIIWGASFFATRKFKLKIEKNLRGEKGPFLIFSTHQGFSDYYIGPLSLFPRRGMYVSDMEGYAAFGKWLYRGIGCIGKRRYVPDLSVISNIKYGLKKGQSVMIFPESRHSNIGTTAYIPKNLGRLAKMLGVPVVTLSINGSYLANPFWDETHTRKVPMKATMECIFTADELKSADASNVQKRIEEKLDYDEYDYQHKTGFLIGGEKRAEGIHKALYQCKVCGGKYEMSSKGAELYCAKCGNAWTLSEDGWLVSGDEKIHIPDWYEWQRKNVINDITRKNDEEYSNKEKCDISLRRSFNVTVKALPNEYGFVDLGQGTLELNEEEWALVFKDVSGKDIMLRFPHKNRESVQTEYDYRGNGACIVLSTKDCCYYLYSDDKDFSVTELQFLGECLYQR